MLGSELSVADNVQVVPDELVRDASADLSAPAAGGYSTATLARLRQRLDADYVISGSYLVAGSADNAPLRVDIALQDTRSGALLAAVSDQSAVSGLIPLAAQAGTTLRGKLGARLPDAQTLGLVPNAQPPNLDVARRLGFALDALQHYDAARARDELLEAVAEAPGYAPAYAYLAQAWEALGFRDKALAAAEQAAQKAANLPPEQRLQTEAVVYAAHAKWSKAADAWRALIRLRPASIEYRLQAIDAQIAAGALLGAQATLAELGRLPDAADDPRVELAQHASRRRSMTPVEASSMPPARCASRSSTTRPDSWPTPSLRSPAHALISTRTRRHARVSSRRSPLTVRSAIRAARRAARTDLAQALGNLNRNQEAREEFQQAMELDRSIGDLAGIAAVYRDLCNMLWLAGDRDGAQAAARDSLELARETGDLALQAWTLQALATIASDEAASDEVLGEYREVVALNVRAGRSDVLAARQHRRRAANARRARGGARDLRPRDGGGGAA